MDISAVPELVNNVSYALMIDKYTEKEMVHPKFCDVRDITPDIVYGVVEDHVGGMGAFVERADSQPVSFDRAEAGFQRQCAMRQQATGFDIPKRMSDASNAVGRITNLATTWANTLGRSARLFKEEYVAGILQKGTLTAGDPLYFDNSFSGHIDTNLNVTYDGLPFFDTAHLAKNGDSYSNHAPTGSLTQSNIETYLALMRVTNAYDERGQRISVHPNAIITPSGAETNTAKRLFGSVQEPGTANNAINVQHQALEVIEWDMLTDDTSCGFICEKGMGLVVYDSGVPEIEITWNARTKSWEVTAEFHFGAMVTDFRYWFNYGKLAA